jgi:hypothetical protein
MSSEDRILLDYMAMLRHLSNDLKLRLISKLTDSIRENEPPMENDHDETWRSLFGAWSDMDDDLADEVRENRLPNREIPSFD